MKTKLTKVGCDSAVLAGSALFAYGLSMAWRPLGFITGGILIAAFAFLAGYGLPVRK